MHYISLLTSSLKGCRSWVDLQQRWSPLTKQQKGDLFEELTKYYLLLEPEYASKLKSVWLLREIPTALAKRLNLPSEDKGIDLVAETKEGEYWAIQSKYREESDQSITWREISTFTGLASLCPGFSYRLIASTTERITDVLKNQDRIGFLALDAWQDLGEEFFSRLQAKLEQRKEPLEPRFPRPHQENAIRDVINGFGASNATRGKLIMPCGTGKSLTSYFIAQELKSKSILIAVPSLSLIKQTLKAWMYESMARKQDVEWICVCSDESAGKVEYEENVVLKQDLGVPCLTNSKDIADWLMRNHNALTIVFTTYQSGQALAKAARKAGFTFDLGIMDEAHKTAGAKDRLFSHLILDKNIKITRRLFMTATERRYRGESDEVLSMDDVEVYGDTFHELSFKKALEYNTPPILSDYKLITLFISEKEIADLVKNKAFVRPEKWKKEIDAGNLAALLSLRKAITEYPISHAVSFHSSIQRARAFQDYNDAYNKTLPNDMAVQTFHVSGETSTGTRARIIKEFATASTSLITNARCLTEGVDVPRIDSILFADPRKSKVDIVQAVGRALRPHEGKEYGYVIVPVVCKENATFDEVLNSDSFNDVLTTIRELGAEDERIVEYFRVISQGGRSEADHPLSEFSKEHLAEEISISAFNEAVRLRVWNRIARLSRMPFREARSIVHGFKFNNEDEWRAALRKRLIPPDIPAAPNTVYKNEWQGWPDWLGYKSIKVDQSKDFVHARRFARRLRLKSQIEWSPYIKKHRPEGIPSAPNTVYANKGWLGWPDWLGYQPKKVLHPRGFKSARAFVRRLGLKNQKEWAAYCQGKLKKKGKKPGDIPSKPQRVYNKSGWLSLGDWLGTGYISTSSRTYWCFIKARKYVRKLKIPSQSKWFAFTRSEKFKYLLHGNIPAAPHNIYNQEWKGWGDWLGTGTIATYNIQYWPYAKARKFARSLHFKGTAQWFQYCKERKNPPQIPFAANNVYNFKEFRDRNWSDFLGTKRAPRNSL